MQMEMEMEKKKVCVTGAGGFVSSWIVKLFLSKGYIVHGTVREPGDNKNAHLTKLERAADNLKLFKAELLDYDSLVSAIRGCDGVIHTACPALSSGFMDPEVEMLEPAVKGTLNVLRACKEMKAKRVIYISSTAAVMMNPDWPKGRVMDETCWSDKDYCKAVKAWYCLAKTEAESLAFEYGKQNGLDIVSLCPSFVFGPVMQPILNTSTSVLVSFANGIVYPKTEPGGGALVPNQIWDIVDVQDVANAVLLTYEKSEAEGRYICKGESIFVKGLAEKLKTLYPDINYVEDFGEDQCDYWTSSEKLQALGWTYRPVEETLVDSIESYKKAGLLD